MKNVIKKAADWCNRPMSVKVFLFMVGSVLSIYFMFLALAGMMDTDVYFLISSGREFLENGICRTNVWTIDPGLSIIIQQWLYGVIVTLFSRFGAAGFVCLYLIQFIIFVCVFRYFMKLRGISRSMIVSFLAVILFMGEVYIFSLRPELITLIFLLLECIVLEQFRSSLHGVKDIAVSVMFLSFLMILEVNMHMSMGLFHFLLLLAYAVPAFYMPGSMRDDLHKYPGFLVFSTLGMCGSMFLNPYGLDGVLYTINSFRSHAFDYVDVYEMRQPFLFSPFMLSILICVLLVFFCRKHGVLRSSTVNIVFGFAVIAGLAIRNNMFMTFAMIFILRDFNDFLTSGSFVFNWRKDVCNYLLPVMVAFNLFVMFLFVSLISADPFDGFFHPDDLTPIYEKIQSDAADKGLDEPRVFTDFNTGGYFQYMGMKNLYIDARPELYTDVFTNGRNILRDYSVYCVYGFDSRDDSHVVTKDEFMKWFEHYDFDYIVVGRHCDLNLATSMLYMDGYEADDSINSDDFILYKKL